MSLAGVPVKSVDNRFSVPVIGTAEAERLGRHDLHKFLENEVARHSSSILGTCGECCERAKLWLATMAGGYEFSVTNQGDQFAPTWLIERYKWGPTQWPTTWCKAIRFKEVDCGVFAAFAAEIFKQQGFDVYRAQSIVEYNKHFAPHLTKKWQSIYKRISWVELSFVYHEICGVVKNGRMELYDPTEGNWLSPNQTRGHGMPLAVNLEAGRVFEWGMHTIGQGRWTVF